MQKLRALKNLAFYAIARNFTKFQLDMNNPANISDKTFLSHALSKYPNFLSKSIPVNSCGNNAGCF